MAIRCVPQFPKGARWICYLFATCQPPNTRRSHASRCFSVAREGVEPPTP